MLMMNDLQQMCGFAAMRTGQAHKTYNMPAGAQFLFWYRVILVQWAQLHRVVPSHRTGTGIHGVHYKRKRKGNKS